MYHYVPAHCSDDGKSKSKRSEIFNPAPRYKPRSLFFSAVQLSASVCHEMQRQLTILLLLPGHNEAGEATVENHSLR